MNNHHDLRKAEDNPDVLSTLEDYQNAPDGTIAIDQSQPPSRYEKRCGKWRWGIYDVSNVSMALRGSLDVIHWGEEK